MGRIIVTQNMSLDGVVESPGEDDSTEFPHKGWVFDYTGLRPVTGSSSRRPWKPRRSCSAA